MGFRREDVTRDRWVRVGTIPVVTVGERERRGSNVDGISIDAWIRREEQRDSNGGEGVEVQR